MEEPYDYDAVSDLPTVDKVGFKQEIAAPTSPASLVVSDHTRDLAYTLSVKGYTPQSIAKKMDIAVKDVYALLTLERDERNEYRQTVGAKTVEDSIHFYNVIKQEALERAKYADDKFAATFYKEASEAQGRIDRLIIAIGAGVKLDDEAADVSAGGKVVYRERKKPAIMAEEDLPNDSPVYARLPEALPAD